MRELTPAELSAFFDIGHVLLPGLFSTEEVAHIAAACDRLVALAAGIGETGQVMHRGSQFVLGQRPDGGLRIDRVVWAGAAEPELLRWGEDPRLLQVVAQLLGAREMDQLINQVHFKLPGDGVEFPWHQDSLHRRYGTPEWRDVNGRGSYVQALLAIDASTRDNGPLWFIDGSCKQGHITTEAPDHELPAALLVNPRPALMQPGDVVFFGPYTIHGSTANTSNQPRRVFINGYASVGANTRVYPGEGSGRRLRA